MECYTRTQPARPALARVGTASFKFSTNTGYTRTQPARPALARVGTASFKFPTKTGYTRTQPARPARHTSSGSSLASRMMAESRPVPRSAGSPVTTFS